MITKAEYAIVRAMLHAYWATLELGDARAEAARKGLLTQNHKLAKGANANWGLELLPADLDPTCNACPAHGACKYSCLAFSGQGNILKGPVMIAGEELSVPLKAKARRSFLLANDRRLFEALLSAEIGHRALVAGLEGKRAGFRLNVTSDHDWSGFVDAHPGVEFYDYTRVWDRMPRPNWHLTWSAGPGVTDAQIRAKLVEGMNVAVVFPGPGLPERFLGHLVVDGDVDDDRLEDVGGVVVGLRAKTTVGGARGRRPAVERR